MNIQLLLDKTVISVLLVLNSFRDAIATQREPDFCWLVRQCSAVSSFVVTLLLWPIISSRKTVPPDTEHTKGYQRRLSPLLAHAPFHPCNPNECSLLFTGRDVLQYERSSAFMMKHRSWNPAIEKDSFPAHNMLASFCKVENRKYAEWSGVKLYGRHLAESDAGCSGNET